MQKIHFYFHDRRINLKQRTKLKQFIENLFKAEKQKLISLAYIFCSDDYLLAINTQFLKHDFYTDVITFDLSPEEKMIEGEIYISIDRVKENARLANTPIFKELHLIIFHGALHLCGYKDKEKKETELMRKKEEKYLKLYFNTK